jgi:hypothetical protein
MSSNYHVRVARPDDAEAVWSLYQRTGFLYPEKLAAMGDGGRRARATFEALLALDSEEHRIVLCENAEGQLRSACTYARFSDTQTWVQHMVSDHDRGALAHALIATGNGAIHSSATWVAYSFRESNTSVRRLFTTPLARVKEGGWSVELASHDFYTIDAARAGRLAQGDPAGGTRPATEADRRHLLCRLEDPSQKAAVQALGRFDREFGTGERAACLARVGLHRERTAFVAEGEDGPTGLVVVDLAPEGWNMSNMSTGITLWQIGDDRATAAVLAARAARWLAERSVRSWTVLAAEGQSALRQVLAEAGVTSTRRYLRLGMPMETLPIFNAAYARFIGRSMELPRVLDYSEVHGARELGRAA